MSRQAEKFLDKLDHHIKKRIEDRLKRLATNPVPSDAKAIRREAGELVFRYRIGDYRALYKVNHSDRIILIVVIDKRSRVYE